MRFTVVFAVFVLGAVFLGLGVGPGDAEAASPWSAVKAEAKPLLALPDEFDVPFRLNLATSGWEDGIHMSRDGLDLYCLYVPGDHLSWTLNSSDVTAYARYLRGPLFSMDLVSNPVGAGSWIHGDILYSHRNSPSGNFPPWVQTGLSLPVFSEGAPFVFEKKGNTLGALLYTSNEKPAGFYGKDRNASGPWDTDIWAVFNPEPNLPAGIKGQPLPGFPRTTFTEDNPCMERLDGNSLVLMFDSENYPGRTNQGLDIWFSLSRDNGKSWSVPANVSTVNSKLQEHQPHLFKTPENEWYLYYSGTNKADGKLAIFRARQKTSGNWNDWDVPQLVIGAGNSAGVGEPTLTVNGDLSFVLIYDKGPADPHDRYDADPWFAKSAKTWI